MKKILHVSSECYPAAKAGGMGDVVGALPIYLPSYDIEASVVIPKYDLKWFKTQKFKKVHKGSFAMDNAKQNFEVHKLEKDTLGFPFFCIHLPGLFDRQSIYLADDGHGFKDEPKRNIAFQTAVLEWLIVAKEKFELLHLHDHMTGLIPFFMQMGKRYKELKSTPSVFTIHNGSYRGEFNWDQCLSLLPEFDSAHAGLLDWDGKINSLAAAIKCAWSINTVSPSYMQELINVSDTLEPLYKKESYKCSGILNGIDSNSWDPKNDIYLSAHLKDGKWKKFKSNHKEYLQDRYALSSKKPMIGFIGRFAHQKGADMLMDALKICFKNKMKFNAVILGSGDKALEEAALKLSEEYPKKVGAEIAYNEQVARHIYAGSDFLIMPSRFEPCGLNQLYAMRYGSIPIASHVGGLKDTVFDFTDDGQGIVIQDLSINEIVLAIERAIVLYKEKKRFSQLRESISALDYSWDNSARLYSELYLNHIN